MGCDIPDPTRPNGGCLSTEDIEPYKSYHKILDIKVTIKYYQQEVTHRDILGDPHATSVFVPNSRPRRNVCNG